MKKLSLSFLVAGFATLVALLFVSPPAIAQYNALGYCTATLSANAATCNAGSGIITTGALATAAGATYSFTITDANLGPTGVNTVINAHVRTDGTSTTGTPVVVSVTPTSGTAAAPPTTPGPASTSVPGTFTVVIQNIHASAALNGTLKIGFAIAPNGQ